jgi:hypothetical protein
MLSVKRRQSGIDPLALVFGCQIAKKFLEAGMFNSEEFVKNRIRAPG